MSTAARRRLMRDFKVRHLDTQSSWSTEAAYSEGVMLTA